MYFSPNACHKFLIPVSFILDNFPSFEQATIVFSIFVGEGAEQWNQKSHENFKISRLMLHKKEYTASKGTKADLR